MKDLVVGQTVWMRSGARLREGRVIGISDDRIEVEYLQITAEDDLFHGKSFALHFRKKGLGSISAPGEQCGVFFYLGDTLGWAEYDRRPLCTEFGPWRLAKADEAEHTIDSDGVRKLIHKLDCPCDYCEHRRAVGRSWRDAGW